MKYGFGVDLGGTTVKLAFFDQKSTLLDKWALPTSTANGGSRILPEIAASITAYIKEKHLPFTELIGIGIGIPGSVLPDGRVETCVNLGWSPVNVVQTLSALTGLAAKAINDASAAALGEYKRGGGAGCRDMVLVTLGTGVGSGIIANGQLITGAHGAGGEIGHITLNREETEICSCGRKGCAEQYCSATGILRLAKRHGFAGEHTTCKDVFDAAAAGDPLADAVLQQVYSYLGQLLANISCVINPEVIVLGGGVSHAGAPLLQNVQAAYNAQCYPATKNTRITLATLGNDAGIYGAFAHLLGG